MDGRREGEDVMSSIRRLVAEEGGPRLGGAAGGRAAARGAGRLVLVQSQRVDAAAPRPARGSDAVLPLRLTSPVVVPPPAPPVPPEASDLGRDELRALIAEVVREELAGPLGARITRNLRLLVRKEMRRILSDDLRE